MGCVSVVNYKLMNEMFMERDVLSTKEFLSMGFNSHDLTRLVSDGKLKRKGRGIYYAAGCMGALEQKLLLRIKI